MLRVGQNVSEDILDLDNLEWVLDSAIGEEERAGNSAAQPVQASGTGAIPTMPAMSTDSGTDSHSHHAGLLWPADAHTHQTGPLWPSKTEPHSSGELGYGGDSALMASHGVMSDNLQANNFAVTMAPAPRSRGTSESGAADGNGNHQPSKKKRTRNAEQMQQNRVAQQKYRERKKVEHEQLQNALDQLTAQLAVLKAMEAQAVELRAHNAQLTETVASQADQIQALSLQVNSQSTELAATRKAAADAAALAGTQQRMILDQHMKLKLQEEVIESLRGRLKDNVEAAFGSQDPKTVCKRMCAAVRTALADAKNVEGLQQCLEQLPEHIIQDICRSLLCEVKQMWPELAVRFQSLGKITPNCCAEAAAGTVGTVA